MAATGTEHGPESGRWSSGGVVAGLYEVGERLGAGGMGVVDRVRHLGWGQDLAVKSPRRELWDGPDGARGFLDEAKVWVDLPPHPHICTCHYVRMIDGVPRIFAEYVPGGSVAEALRSGGIGALAEILDVAVQMAAGLLAAHRAGVVHQDVKPANVLLAADGTAKITDFGLARAQARAEADPADGDATSTQGGLTPAYASPEQLAGRPAGQPSDQWSWAVSVLELFTGRATWAAGSVAAEALESHLAEGAAPGRPMMPDAVAALLRECFTVDPSGRPAGMDVVAERLRTVYEDELGRRYPREEGVPVAHLAGGLNNKALSLLDLGRPDDAETCWEKALRADPRYSNATFNRGILQWRDAKITDRRLVDLLEAVREADAGAGIRDGQAQYLLGLVHLERGDSSAAAAALGEAARLAPADPEIASTLRAATTDQSVRPARALTGHTRVVTAVAMTPDGRYAVSGGYDNSVRVWDLGEGRCLRTLKGHRGHVDAVAITADGRHALSGSDDGTARWWDLGSGRCLRKLKSHSGHVTAVAITPDGRHALTGDLGGTLHRWDLPLGRRLGTLTGHRKATTSVALTPDARYALSGDPMDGTVHFWDLGGGQRLLTLTGHTGGAHAVAITPDGRYALTGGENALARWWDLSDGRCLRTLTGHTGWVVSVAVASDGRHAVTGGLDDTVRWWDLATGRCLRTMTGPSEAVTSVAVSGDARQVIAGGLDATVRWWELSPGIAAPWVYSRPQAAADVSERAAEFRSRIDEARRSLDRGDPGAATSALRAARAISGFTRHPELTDLWRRAGRGRPRVMVLDVRQDHALGHSGTVPAVAMTPDGRHALTGSGDHTARWWDLGSGKCLNVLAGHAGTVSAVAVTPDARLAVTASYDDTLRVWDLADGRSRTLTGHTASLNAVAVTPDGRYAITGAEDRTARWWDLTAGRCLHVLTGHSSVVTSVAVTPDARVALTGGADGAVLGWNLADGTFQQYDTPHTSWVTSITLAPDAGRALTTSNDHTLRWWDLIGGHCLRTFTGHTSWVKSAAITRDARHALSGSLDGTVRLWDLDDGRCLRIVPGHDGHVLSVSLSADGHRAAFAGLGHAAQVWEIDWDYE
ncbi:protein kinase [Actinomadura sp. 9N215]|uniref:protein kinase domain-containing protein n=1 Tax=Actinomadura sp. 9N215 TaxID=3375150 RepID=UPI00379285DD